MAFFFEKGPLKVEFRIVRAYVTSEDIRNKTGIIANFSAKTIIHTGKEEIEAMCHNALTLTLSRQNHLFISSAYEQHPVVRNGNKTMSPKVYYFSLLPGSDRSDEAIETYDKFVETCAEDIRKFIIEARTRKEEEPKERILPASAMNLAALSPIKADNKEEINSGDIPF
jgi:hypothetical protein